MQNWYQKLLEIDQLKNHKKNLKTALEAYLTSEYANNKHERTDMLVLFNHLDKLE